MLRASWYQAAREVCSLRKNILRVDLRVYVAIDDGSVTNPAAADPAIRSMLTAAIANGLDVVGLVSPLGPQVGWRGQQLAMQENLDIWVVPAEEYLCADKTRLLIYMLKGPMRPNLSMEQACAFAHHQGAFVLATEVTRGQAKRINALAGSAGSPDGVEIYNAAVGSYTDIEVDLPKFISSASRNAADMEQTNVYTLVRREELESMGLLPEDAGVNFEPDYLKNNRLRQTAPGQAMPGHGATKPQPAENDLQ